MTLVVLSVASLPTRFANAVRCPCINRIRKSTTATNRKEAQPESLVAQ